MAARKPTLSPTRICTYLDCPRKYRFVYIDRLPRYFAPRAAFSFGVSLHRALQEHHEAGGPQAEDARALLSRLERDWVRAGYQSDAHEQERLAQGRQILEAYHESRGGLEGTTLFTEKLLRADMGEYVLSGRVDRLDALSDGALEVVDYKSGSHAPSVEAVAEDLPLAIYQLLCVREFDCPRVKGSIYHLRTSQKVSVIRCASDLEPVARGVSAVFADIQADDEFRPVAGDHCQGCDFRLRCWGR